MIRDGLFVERLEYEVNERCEHYTYTDNLTVAAISQCASGKLTGFVSAASDGLAFDILGDGSEVGEAEDVLVTRADKNIEAVKIDDALGPFVTYQLDSNQDLPAKDLTVELALFLDAEAYANFGGLYNHYGIIDSVLASINQVQSLYSLESLFKDEAAEAADTVRTGNGGQIKLTIVSFEVQLRPPIGLPLYGGEQYSLLDSFCGYQASLAASEAEIEAESNSEVST